VKLERTYQLNFGGNMDFMNMLERERLISKKVSKTQSVQSQLRKNLNKHDIHIGPSDHVPWLEDRKWAQIRLEGKSFGDVPLNLELKLEVWDSPNSAGIVIDAIRCCRLAMDRGVGGPLIGPSAYFMKSPPVQFSDDAAREMVEEFILGNGGSKAADWSAFFDTQTTS
jgi:myo-inositol-1-phosphate synthase